MAGTLASLMNRLERDAWRDITGFSPEMLNAMDVTLGNSSEDEIKAVLDAWIRKQQPCLFGRIAAKESAITYCLISERMLQGSEDELENHIQKARLEWTCAGFEGKSSNFIIAVLSSKLAYAKPDENVKQIALRLCSLYLQEPIDQDQIYLDRLWLEQSASRKATWEWLAGVNYFSAQGDGRWWQDHRFPAAIAFSTNSVGHMVKSGALASALRELDEKMGTAFVNYKAANVTSLGKALGLAMSTINNASNAVSGKATFLVAPMKVQQERPECPVKLQYPLHTFDYCEYKGFYHTDHTIPSLYFRPEIDRPPDAELLQLDFTYLFDDALDNPDHDRMGTGRRIRSSANLSNDAFKDERYRFAKRFRGLETEVQISDAPRLQEALRLHRQS
ncbi:MAG: hypothetical protein JWQ87_3742 [Candidatus Sulfotelmatobacter sp.]|nr:hypothetical protein [Candidatus Sulfotelmatobacter sp.]